MTLSRRRFLQAAGLIVTSTALGSAASLETVGRAMAARLPSVAVAVTGAGLFAGPGNVDYRLLGTLAKGQRVTPLGLFGDFVRVTATSIRTPAGTLVRHTTSGYVLRTALGRVPAGLHAVPLTSVPWVGRTLIAPSGPLVMPSVGMLQDGYKTYILLDGTWYATRDFRIAATLGFVTATAAPATSLSGLVIQNVTATRGPDNVAQLVLLHGGSPASRRWHFGYSPGTDWEFFEDLPISPGDAGRAFTIAVDGTGHVVTLGMPTGHSVSHRLRTPLFRRGDVLSVQLSDSPFTDFTASATTLSLAPLGKVQRSHDPYGSLREEAKKVGITIGSAANTWRPSPDPRYEQVLADQFNLLVPGGEFDWEWLICPDATHYNFAGADEQVHFAQRHGMAIRAYLLPSGSDATGLPAWLTGAGYSRDDLLAIVHDHIDTVVGRYKGVVSEWLVASETIYDGTFVPWNFWLKNVGLDFIDQVFTWTRAADPAAKLLYEFSSNEWAEPQASAIYNHIADLKRRGIPVDDVGFEMHVDGAAPPTKAQLLGVMQRLGTLGVGVQVNEMDVNVYGVPGTLADKYAVQAQVFRDALEALLESGVGTGFTTWDFVDPESWLFLPDVVKERGPAQAPLLFDDNYQPKPAYFALLDVLKQRAGLS